MHLLKAIHSLHLNLPELPYLPLGGSSADPPTGGDFVDERFRCFSFADPPTGGDFIDEHFRRFSSADPPTGGDFVDLPLGGNFVDESESELLSESESELSESEVDTEDEQVEEARLELSQLH